VNTLDAVAAVHRGAGVCRLADRALLEVRGSDRVRFLQGQLTNDVATLDAATRRAGCYALALTREGRIVADLHVVARPDSIWLETDAGSAPALLARLEKYVIADDVAIRDRSAEFARFAIEGPRAQELVSGAAGAALALAPDDVADVSIGAVAVVASGWGFGHEPAVQLLAPSAGERAVRAALEAAAASIGAIVVDAAVLEVLRIEAGRPRAGSEIGPDTLAAELRLVERAVSFTKGCYTGQEIVARMESRGRVGHLLVGIGFEGTQLPEPRQPIRSGDARIGELTSVAQSPRAGVIGLAIVRNGFDAPGTTLDVGGRAGRVVELPFVPAPPAQP
jgi:folate-binding protein YgfZ